MITELIVGVAGLAMIVSNARLSRLRPYADFPVLGVILGVGLVAGAIAKAAGL